MLPIRNAFRRRPLSSLAAASSVAALGYANYIEWKATGDEDDALAKTIPRSHYDPDAIARYWERRPVSIIKRLGSVAHQLAPLAGAYLMEFQVRPRMNRSLNGGDGSTSEETQRKLRLESELSQKLRRSLTHLGPTFVKVGQQLSIRPDLVSPTVLHELQRLCDAVPPFADEIALNVLAGELSSAIDDNARKKPMLNRKEVNDTLLKVFEEIPVLVASASLGQVYKATLRGKYSQSSKGEVAIKIQRPDILETVSLDLFLLVCYGRAVDKLCSMLTNQIPYHEKFLNGFAAGAFMELNYIHEAENQMFFRDELHSRFHGNNTQPSHEKSSIMRRFWNDSNRNVDKVIVPKVFEQFTTQRVLVSEWIDGVPLAQAPKEQIRELIPVGVELFLCQLLDIGRFHADPHPGEYICFLFYESCQFSAHIACAMQR